MDLHAARNFNIKIWMGVLFGLTLVILEAPSKAINYVEKLVKSKDAETREILINEALKDEPEKVKAYFRSAKASSGTAVIQKEVDHKDDDEEVEKDEKKRVGFRDRRIIAYEDRIRSYSTPDKIFRYFATINDVSSTEVYMTPEDFVRSITPGQKQPDGLGLDCFRRVDLRKEKIVSDIPQDSVFYLFGENAVISFSDYIFLLTVISTPQRQFEIAFRMFDLNGDGELDIGEFEVVRSIIKSGSAMGKRHRDNSMTGSMLNNQMNSSLSKYFFGADGNKKLTIQEFLKFQQTLQKEIMKLEFNRYNPEDSRISEVDFADALLMYAGFSENKKRKSLRRVRLKFSGEESIGITFDDYVAFSQLLRCISDVDTALTFYHLAGASIDQITLKHVSNAVAGVNLSDHVIDIVFTLFDENNDGHLSNKEFVSVMKQRLLRGLDKPMDTGFIRLLSAMGRCSTKIMMVD